MQGKIYALIFSLIVTLHLPLASAAEGPTPRIVGGYDADVGAWPWMVALIYTNGSSNYKGQFCGGTLIQSQWVLTAAHCVYDMKASDFNAVFGLYDLKADAGTAAAVKKIWVHPDWNVTTLDSDLALLELAAPVNFPLVTLSSHSGFSGQEAIALGWGSTDPAGNQYPHILQQVTVPIVDLTTCHIAHTQTTPLTGTMLCAGYPEGGKDTCSGDSGGPLIVVESNRYTQTGVASWGNNCAAENTYGIYSDLNVSKLRKFINDTTASPANNATDTVLAVEEPTLNSTYSGVANVRGWAVSANGMNKIDLLVDGKLLSSIPQGGARKDVGNAFPTYPNASNAGFSMAYNYSSLPPGQHTFTIRAIDSKGNTKEQVIPFSTVRFNVTGSFISDPRKITLSGSTLTMGENGRSIVIGNLSADGKSYAVLLDWNTAMQGFSITNIVETK